MTYVPRARAPALQLRAGPTFDVPLVRVHSNQEQREARGPARQHMIRLQRRGRGMWQYANVCRVIYLFYFIFF